MGIALDLFLNNKDPFLYVSQFSHNETVSMHSHEFYEFVYIESGFLVHNLNNHIAILIPGDIFGMRPGDSHSYFNVRDSKIYNCLFYRDALKECIDKLALLPGISNIFDVSAAGMKEQKKTHLDVAMRREISSVLRKMELECQKFRAGSDLKLHSHLVDFLILVSRSYGTNTEIHSPMEYSRTNRILSALEYIEMNFSKPIEVSELAALCTLNTDYFSRLFKSLCGLTPSDYLLLLRVSKASELLLKSNGSIADITSAVGFSDQNYFARIFKKVTGTSPSAYRVENNSLHPIENTGYVL